MPKYPSAIWDSIPGANPGAYTSGPAKIVHHKTVGGNYPRATYLETKGVPHFTVGRVDGTSSPVKVWQHFDTSQSSRALLNRAGGVQTNRDTAIQIEVIGYPGVTDIETAEETRKLTDWIEKTHKIPHTWPAGRPPQAVDKGSHISSPINRFTSPQAKHMPRDSAVWDNVSGHYGHCHVPENTHFDPAYTDEEWEIIYGNGGGFKLPVLPTNVPEGAIDEIKGAPGYIQIGGWAIDLDTPKNVVEIDVYIGTPGAEGTIGFGAQKANLYRSDLGVVFPEAGSEHGFHIKIDGLTPGRKKVYVYAKNTGPGPHKLLTEDGIPYKEVTVGPLFEINPQPEQPFDPQPGPPIEVANPPEPVPTLDHGPIDESINDEDLFKGIFDRLFLIADRLPSQGTSS